VHFIAKHIFKKEKELFLFSQMKVTGVSMMVKKRKNIFWCMEKTSHFTHSAFHSARIEQLVTV